MFITINGENRKNTYYCVVSQQLPAISKNFRGIQKIQTADKRKRLTAEEAARLIVEFARERAGVVRQAEESQMLGLSERQTRDYLSGMVQCGVMEKAGANKDRTYKLVENR